MDRRFKIDEWETPPVEPTGGGIECTIRPDPHTARDMLAAFAKIRANPHPGGNVIRFLEGRHTNETRARGALAPGAWNAPHGTAEHPNVFTGDPGHELVGRKVGAHAFPVIDLAGVWFWDVIGLTIVGSDYAGIRLQHSGGNRARPARVWGNSVSGCAHAAIVVQGWWRDPWAISNHVDIAGNTVDGAGGHPNPEYREGIYLGQGYNPPERPEWVDRTRNIRIRCNRIRNMRSDSIEVKVGVTRWVIEDNEIWGARLAAGTETTSRPVGHVTACYANTPNPDGPTPAHGVIRRNRLWDLHQTDGPIRAPILVGQGGIQVTSNIVTDFDGPTAIVADTGRGGMGAGPILIAHNTTTEDKRAFVNVDNYGDVTETANTPDQGPTVFVGPTKPPADRGWGPLSGFTPNDDAPWDPGPVTDATDTPFVDPPPLGALNPD